MDGSFRPGIDPGYPGNSDTGLSGMAAPAYATILCHTFGWSVPYPAETVEFFFSCQEPDGAFIPPAGSMDQHSPHARLYNTLQAIISLRLLGEKPRYDPMPVIDFFFQEGEFKELPLYTTSFFPLFFTALGKEMPEHIDQRMRSLSSASWVIHRMLASSRPTGKRQTGSYAAANRMGVSRTSLMERIPM
jgi:geranylgeranyl transferase type-2 subunit beta